MLDVRCRRFDKYIDEIINGGVKPIKTKDMIMLTAKTPEKFTTEIIDDILTEFQACKAATAVIIVYERNGIQITESVSRKNIHWVLEDVPVPEDKPTDMEHKIKLDYSVTEDELDAKIQTLKQFGGDNASRCIFSGDDVFDYGSTSARVNLSLKIKKSDIISYSFKTEGIALFDPEHPDEPQDAVMNGLVLHLKDKKFSDNGGMIFIGIATLLHMFKPEYIEMADAVAETESDSDIVLKTDFDLNVGMDKPEGFDGWDGKSENPEYLKYYKMLMAAEERNKFWNVVFSYAEFRSYIELYVKHLRSEGKLDGHEIQMFQTTFLKYLEETSMLEGFNALYSEKVKKYTEDRAKMDFASRIASYLKDKPEVIESIKSYRTKLKESMATLAKLGDECENREEVLSKWKDAPIRTDAANARYDCALKVMLGANMCTEEQLKEKSTSEIVDLESFSMIESTLDIVCDILVGKE